MLRGNGVISPFVPKDRGIESKFWLWYKFFVMGVIAVEKDPRVVLFGDITGIPVQTVHRFFESAGHPPYVGSFPSYHNGHGAEVARETYELLIQAGISDTSPVTPCDSAEERVRQILQNPALLNRQGITDRPILIIDKDPKSLLKAAAHMSEGAQTNLLSHTTVISLGPGEPVDYVDPNTNLRLVTLPPYCYPTHPTPAS